MPDHRVFKDLGVYLELGLPIAMMLTMELFVFEAMLLFCGRIDVQTQAAQIIVNSIYVFMFCLGLGIQSAGCTFVGFQIGKGDLKNALEYYRVSRHFALFVGIFSSLALYFMFNNLLALYTHSPSVQRACFYVLPVACITIIFDIY